jgi:hypothetical protein
MTADGSMAGLRRAASGRVARNAMTLAGGPAGRSPPGTHVTVRSYDVISNMLGKHGYELQPWAKAIAPDHEFVEYDDGRERYIYRGGPRKGRLTADVTPAERSRDNGRGERVLYSTFLPGVPAREAIKPAQTVGREIRASRQPYLVFDSNSNSAVGDVTERQFGRRIGDGHTPGHLPPPLYPMTTPIL